MPNWKKVILSGSNAELNAITMSGNIIPDSDNIFSLGASDNRFQLNGGTPVTVTGSGTQNFLARWNGATELQDSFIQSTDTLTTIQHSNDGNDIFIVSGSNGQQLTVTDEIGQEIFRVNDSSGLELFTVSGSGRLIAPNLVFRDSDDFVLSYQSASGEISFRSASSADFNTLINKPILFSGSAQVVNSLNNQDVDFGTGDITAVTASIDYALVNDTLQGNGSGFQFFAFNEDTVKVKFANWYSSNDRQYGMGQLWYETWFAAIDNTAGKDNRRIGFYLEEPDSGSSDADGGSGGHPSNSRFYVDINGAYLSGSFEASGDITGSSLQLSNLGSQNEIVLVGANNEVTSSNLLSIDTTNDRIGIGTSSPDVKLDLVGETSGEAQVRVAQHDNGGDGPDIRFFKSRGTAAAPSAVNNDDYVGAVNAFVYDGSNYQQGGFFGFQAEGTNGDTTFGIRTRVDGTLSDRIAVDAAGDVDISGSLTAQSATVDDFTINDTLTATTITGSLLRLSENGSGLRLTNVGGFEPQSGVFNIFGNNNVTFGAGGSGAGERVLTLVESNRHAQFETAVSASVFSGSFVGDGSQLTGTRYEEDITGNTSYTITHNLNEDYPIVQVYDTNKLQVLPGIISASNANTVLLEFDTNFTGRVIVKK